MVAKHYLLLSQVTAFFDGCNAFTVSATTNFTFQMPHPVLGARAVQGSRGCIIRTLPDSLNQVYVVSLTTSEHSEV